MPFAARSRRQLRSLTLPARRASTQFTWSRPMARTGRVLSAARAGPVRAAAPRRTHRPRRAERAWPGDAAPDPALAGPVRPAEHGRWRCSSACSPSASGRRRPTPAISAGWSPADPPPGPVCPARASCSAVMLTLCVAFAFTTGEGQAADPADGGQPGGRCRAGPRAVPAQAVVVDRRVAPRVRRPHLRRRGPRRTVPIRDLVLSESGRPAPWSGASTTTAR